MGLACGWFVFVDANSSTQNTVKRVRNFAIPIFQSPRSANEFIRFDR